MYIYLWLLRLLPDVFKRKTTKVKEITFPGFWTTEYNL